MSGSHLSLDHLEERLRSDDVEVRDVYDEDVGGGRTHVRDEDALAALGEH